jgi:hypothetical protein
MIEGDADSLPFALHEELGDLLCDYPHRRDHLIAGQRGLSACKVVAPRYA